MPELNDKILLKRAIVIATIVMTVFFIALISMHVEKKENEISVAMGDVISTLRVMRELDAEFCDGGAINSQINVEYYLGKFSLSVESYLKLSAIQKNSLKEILAATSFFDFYSEEFFEKKDGKFLNEMSEWLFEEYPEVMQTLPAYIVYTDLTP